MQVTEHAKKEIFEWTQSLPVTRIPPSQLMCTHPTEEKEAFQVYNRDSDMVESEESSSSIQSKSKLPTFVAKQPSIPKVGRRVQTGEMDVYPAESLTPPRRGARFSTSSTSTFVGPRMSQLNTRRSLPSFGHTNNTGAGYKTENWWYMEQRRKHKKGKRKHLTAQEGVTTISGLPLNPPRFSSFR